MILNDSPLSLFHDAKNLSMPFLQFKAYCRVINFFSMVIIIIVIIIYSFESFSHQH